MNNSRQTNLHSLWDSGLIHYRMSQDFNSDIALYYDYLYTLMRNQTPTNNNSDFMEWIMESAKLVCQQVYTDEAGQTMNASSVFHLRKAYYEKNIPVIERRLIQGGQRLGVLLNDLVTKRSKPPSKPDKLCWGIIAFIAVVSVQLIVIIVLIVIRMSKRRKAEDIFTLSNPFTK